jgi:DNA-binding MarR family transcriptional regulator
MSLRDPAQHDELLNYRLKRIVSLGGAPAIRLCEGRYGVSRFEWRLVAALVEEGPMAPTALVRRTGVDAARASLGVRALVAKHLATRRIQDGDRRRAVVSVTPQGYALYAELFPQLAAINRRLVEALDDEEVAVLDRCLAKLAARALAIEAAGGGNEARANRRLGGSRRTVAFPRPHSQSGLVGGG